MLGLYGKLTALIREIDRGHRRTLAKKRVFENWIIARENFEFLLQKPFVSRSFLRIGPPHFLSMRLAEKTLHYYYNIITNSIAGTDTAMSFVFIRQLQYLFPGTSFVLYWVLCKNSLWIFWWSLKGPVFCLWSG